MTDKSQVAQGRRDGGHNTGLYLPGRGTSSASWPFEQVCTKAEARRAVQVHEVAGSYRKMALVGLLVFVAGLCLAPVQETDLDLSPGQR